MKRARGLTLLEVVASLALVATTAVVLLEAQGNSLAQLRTLGEQERAAELAGELITSWRLDPQALTASSEGDFDAHPGWSWRRTSIPLPLGNAITLREVTLSVFHTDARGTRTQVLQYTWVERVREHA